MESILLRIPPEVVTHLKIPPKRAQKVLMQELVLRLYEEGFISSGHGAYLLKMDRPHFERFLAEHEVAIHSDDEEIMEEISALDRTL